MYAVIKTGGKQYRVKQDDVLTVELLPGESGATFNFDQVLMVSGESGVSVGSPTVSGASVSAEVVGPARGEKLTIFKKKRRHNYRRKLGHRQQHTILRIVAVGEEAKKAAPKKAAAAKTEAPVEAAAETPAAEAAPKKAPAKKAATKKAADTDSSADNA